MKFLACLKIVNPNFSLMLAVDWAFGERARLLECYGPTLKVSQRKGWVSGFSKLYVVFMFSFK